MHGTLYLIKTGPGIIIIHSGKNTMVSTAQSSPNTYHPAAKFSDRGKVKRFHNIYIGGRPCFTGYTINVYKWDTPHVYSCIQSLNICLYFAKFYKIKRD